MEKRNRERGKALLILAVLGIMLFSLYQLYDTYAPYLSGKRKYSSLQEIARGSDKDQESLSQDSKKPQGQGSKGSEQGYNAASGDQEDKNNDAQPVIRFETLQEINTDIVGWIFFEEPSEIDYPIVQGKDNQEYLTRTFDEDGHKYGTIFIDVDNSPDFTDRNTFIYGHHMRNGSMFAGLLDYMDKEYYDAHPYFTIYTLDNRTLTYQVCSVEITAEGTFSYQWKYDSEEIWEEYCTFIMNNSSYSTGVNLDADSRLVSLSTCLNASTSQRLLLHGVLIGET